MLLRCIFCVLSSFVIFALIIRISYAQDKPSEVRKRVVYKEKSYYDFEDTLINGDKAGPEGSSVFRKDRVPFKSSLNLKRSFMPELKDSAAGAN